MVQGVGYEKDALITYSLGNFVFDQGGQETSEGVILRCLLDTSGVKNVGIAPLLIDKSQPTLLDAEKGAPILDRIWKVTQEQGVLRNSGQNNKITGFHREQAPRRRARDAGGRWAWGDPWG